jgi:hypothetical protein
MKLTMLMIQDLKKIMMATKTIVKSEMITLRMMKTTSDYYLYEGRNKDRI